MLIRISLIVAIIGGLAVAGIDFFVLKNNITTTIADRDTFHQNWVQETGLHQKFERQYNETKTKLDKTTAQLATARQERDDAVAKQAEEAKTLASTQDTLKKTQADLDGANDKLAAWDALNIPITQARITLNSLKQVQDEEVTLKTEKDVIFAHAEKLQAELNDIRGIDPDPEMPDGLRGKVLAVDPRYDFVVLDVGQKEGAVLNGKLLVSRNGKLVAKLRITDDVQSERCIANVLPGWKLSDIMEGDEVFY